MQSFALQSQTASPSEVQQGLPASQDVQQGRYGSLPDMYVLLRSYLQSVSLAAATAAKLG